MNESDLIREQYSARQKAKLAKAVEPFAFRQDAGRTVCPFCKHMEARWRSAPASESQRLQVRIRCSQCQLSGTVDLPRETWWRSLLQLLRPKPRNND